MGKNEKPVEQATEKKEVAMGSEAWIDQQNKLTTEHVAMAQKMRKETLDERRVKEVDIILEQTDYVVRRQVLQRQESSKKEEAESKYLKSLSVIDPKTQECIGGLMFEVIQGKHDTVSFDKKKSELRSTYQKELNEIENHFTEYRRKLRTAFPNYRSSWDWDN